MAFNSSESVTEELIKRIGEHLKDNMPNLSDVLYEFPESNIEIDYPSLSIIQAGDLDYTPEMTPYPYVEIGSGDITASKADVRYVVGQYNGVLQLDLWCRNKEERDDLYEEFFQAFNSQFPVLGLTLSLTDYHSALCRYDLRGSSKEDSEISSQRKEWRVRIDVMFNCKAILEKEEFIVEETEVTSDIQVTSEPI